MIEYDWLSVENMCISVVFIEVLQIIIVSV